MQTPEVNCYGSLQYRCRVNDGNTQSTSETSVIFYLDGSQSYEFSVRAVNKEDFQSEFATETGTSPPMGK